MPVQVQPNQKSSHELLFGFGFGLIMVTYIHVHVYSKMINGFAAHD